MVGSRTQTPDRQSLLRAIRTIQRQSGIGQTRPVDGRTQRTKSDSSRAVVFEFLGVRPQDTMLETDLEHALLDKLEPFLLELGRGFCFEARQKRIVIGGEYFYVDLVFYHRILKCHVLVELKTEPFNHENLGQLNTYLNWYAQNEQSDGDNPPVGILLCTNKNDALVKYAVAGMDNQLVRLTLSGCFARQKPNRGVY